MTQRASEPLSILFGTGSLYNANSGPFLTTLYTTHQLRKMGHHVSVLGTRQVSDDSVPAEWSGLQTVAFPKLGPASLHFAPRAGNWLRKSNLTPDVISLEGVWLHLFGKIASWAHKHGIPYIISAHGNFNPVALSVSSWKKSLARHWFVNDLLRHASCIHAITEKEVEWIRNYGLRHPICVIPNGVEPPPLLLHAPSRDISRQRTVLYLGRLHQIKGLDLLLRAWSEAWTPNWRLVIAGNDDGFKDELVKLGRTLNVSSSVEFAGPVQGHEKAEKLASCDFFVLPSRSEGMAMAPLEAMSYGKPVLLTSNCNFPEAERAGAGMQVNCTTASLAAGLCSMMSLGPTELQRMGSAARTLVENRYNWPHICGELEKVYGWLAGRNPRPDSVRTE